MKTNINIFNKLNEDVQEPININTMIDALIKDEEEAINQYNNALKDLTNMNLTDNQINTVTYYISHIIEEEQEHIEELNKVKELMNK